METGMPWSNFNVEITLNDVHVQFSFTRGQEDTLINLELQLTPYKNLYIQEQQPITHLFRPCSKKLSQCASDSCLLSCTTWAIKEHMRKVSGGGLHMSSSVLYRSLRYNDAPRILICLTDHDDSEGHPVFLDDTTADSMRKFSGEHSHIPCLPTASY